MGKFVGSRVPRLVACEYDVPQIVVFIPGGDHGAYSCHPIRYVKWDGSQLKLDAEWSVWVVGVVIKWYPMGLDLVGAYE